MLSFFGTDSKASGVIVRQTYTPLTGSKMQVGTSSGAAFLMFVLVLVEVLKIGDAVAMAAREVVRTVETHMFSI